MAKSSRGRKVSFSISPSAWACRRVSSPEVAAISEASGYSFLYVFGDGASDQPQSDKTDISDMHDQFSLSVVASVYKGTIRSRND